MKSLSIIALLSVSILTGCYPAYQRGYSGYSSGYSTGYGVRSYSDYPASMYYRQSTVPSYSYRYSTPHHRYGREYGAPHYDWGKGHDRHEENRGGQHRWHEERNPVGSRLNPRLEMQNRRNYGDREALWQAVPHANNYGQRRDGGGATGRERGGWEGGTGRHHSHGERR